MKKKYCYSKSLLWTNQLRLSPIVIFVGLISGIRIRELTFPFGFLFGIIFTLILLIVSNFFTQRVKCIEINTLNNTLVIYFSKWGYSKNIVIKVEDLTYTYKNESTHNIYVDVVLRILNKGKTVTRIYKLKDAWEISEMDAVVRLFDSLNIQKQTGPFWQ